jgi:hypothetical protein
MPARIATQLGSTQGREATTGAGLPIGFLTRTLREVINEPEFYHRPTPHAEFRFAITLS